MQRFRRNEKNRDCRFPTGVSNYSHLLKAHLLKAHLLKASAAGLASLAMFLAGPGEATAATVTKLNQALVSGGNVSSFKVTGDGTYVLFSADAETDGVDELYSVARSGGTAVKLSRSLTPPEMIPQFWISPDYSRVIYAVEGSVSELISIPVGGGSGTVLDSGNVADFMGISADSSLVVYREYPVLPGPAEMYSIPIGGGSATLLSQGSATGAGAINASLTPDGATVLFTYQASSGGPTELYKAPIGGGSIVKLSGTLPAGYDVGLAFFASDDSSRAFFTVNNNFGLNTYSYYSAPLAGGALVDLAPTMTSFYSDYFWLMDSGNTFAFSAGDGSFTQGEIYTVPVTGGSLTKISGTPDPSAAVVNPYSIAVSPDLSTTVFRSDLLTPGTYELFAAQSGGGTPVRLNSALAPGGTLLGRPLISPDSSIVAYDAEQDGPPFTNMYASAIDGAWNLQLSAPFTGTVGVVSSDKKFSGDSQWLGFLRSDATNLDLKIVPATGGDEITASAPLASVNSWFYEFELAGDASWAVYRAEQDTEGTAELYFSNISGPCAPAARLTCSTSKKDIFKIRYAGASSTKNKLLFKSIGLSQETLTSDFGDPTGTGQTFTLCLYDADTGGSLYSFDMEVPGGGSCAGKPCWSASSRGFKFKDKTKVPLNDGAKTIALTAGAAGRGKIALKASSSNLPLPAPNLPSFFNANPTVMVQLNESSTGNCWEALFQASDIKANTGTQFKALRR